MRVVRSTEDSQGILALEEAMAAVWREEMAPAYGRLRA